MVIQRVQALGQNPAYRPSAKIFPTDVVPSTEIRNYGDNDEEILSYFTGDILLTNGNDAGVTGARVDYLHADQPSHFLVRYIYGLR